MDDVDVPTLRLPSLLRRLIANSTSAGGVRTAGPTGPTGAAVEETEDELPQRWRQQQQDGDNSRGTD